jgi:hypothetical protein
MDGATLNERVVSAIKRAQTTVLVVVIVWVAAHTVIVWLTGWSSWRFGGFGMYAQPYNGYRAAAVVACDEDRCPDERADIRFFMPLDDDVVPLLAPARSGRAHYVVLSSRRAAGRLEESLAVFKRTPTGGYAEGLVRARVSEPCGPYLVAHYQQHVSMLSRSASVLSRPFVVSMRC